MSPMRVQMAAPPTPRSAPRRPIVPPSPRPFSVAAQLFKLPPPSAAQTSAWQTPTITRFLTNSHKSRTPGSLARPTPLSFGLPAAAAVAAPASSKGFADTSVILEGSQADGESLLDDTFLDDGDSSFPSAAAADDDDDTVMLSLPEPAAPVLAAPSSPLSTQPPAVAPSELVALPALVEPPLQPIPVVAEAEPDEPTTASPPPPAAQALTDAQIAILVRRRAGETAPF
jgi:hypothetical protein